MTLIDPDFWTFTAPCFPLPLSVGWTEWLASNNRVEEKDPFTSEIWSQKNTSNLAGTPSLFTCACSPEGKLWNRAESDLRPPVCKGGNSACSQRQLWNGFCLSWTLRWLWPWLTLWSQPCEEPWAEDLAKQCPDSCPQKLWDEKNVCCFGY